MCDVPSTLPLNFFNNTHASADVEDSVGVVDCWLDCDPGHDDMMAIILACFNPRINLVGISTTAGNQGLDKTTRNALNVLNITGLISKTTLKSLPVDVELKLSDAADYGGLKIPVIKGCAKPLIRPTLICEEIHGESGLEGAHFPAIPSHALEFTERISTQTKHFTTSIYEHFKAMNTPVTVITTGPMTNLALLLTNYPDVTKYIEKVVLMGGACGIGNIMPSSEFNILVDPEAVHIVFESDLKIFMVPLEVTHTLLATPDIISRIHSLNSTFSATITSLLLFFKKTYETVFGFVDPPLHDPATVALVIAPKLFYYRLMRVDVELHSNLTYGQTVCDIYGMSQKKKNVHVCLKIDTNGFWDLICDSVNEANKQSSLN